MKGVAKACFQFILVSYEKHLQYRMKRLFGKRMENPEENIQHAHLT